ncbi:tetratricopeptide repeat protein [bacterium]|nr:tetratricopeptide repeat protein [bacterium]
MKKIILILLFGVASSFAQTKISVFPFENKSDSKYEWFSYGIGQLLSEGLNGSGKLQSIGGDDVFQAALSTDINPRSLYDGLVTPSFLKYHLDWKSDYAVLGNFSITGDSIAINIRACSILKKTFTTPTTVKGKFEKYTDFYLTSIRLMEAVYAQLITLSDVTITRDDIEKSNDRLRQLIADYEGYQTYVKNWMALKYYDAAMMAATDYKLDDAVSYFKRSMVMDELKQLNSAANLSNVYVLRGNKYSTEKKWPEAENDYKAALELNSKNADAFYNLGNVYKEKNDWDNAIAHYKKALELKSNFFEAHVNVGFASLQQGKYSEAIVAYDNALKIKPDDAMTAYYIGTAYDQNGDVSNAIQFYRRAIELDKTIAGAHLNLGILLKGQKDLKGARIEYESAITYEPNNAVAHRNLGILLMNDKKEAAQAIVHLEKSLELDPNQDGADIMKKNIGILKKRAKKK